MCSCKCLIHKQHVLCQIDNWFIDTSNKNVHVAEKSQGENGDKFKRQVKFRQQKTWQQLLLSGKEKQT